MTQASKHSTRSGQSSPKVTENESPKKGGSWKNNSSLRDSKRSNESGSWSSRKESTVSKPKSSTRSGGNSSSFEEVSTFDTPSFGESGRRSGRPSSLGSSPRSSFEESRNKSSSTSDQNTASNGDDSTYDYLLGLEREPNVTDQILGDPLPNLRQDQSEDDESTFSDASLDNEKEASGKKGTVESNVKESNKVQRGNKEASAKAVKPAVASHREKKISKPHSPSKITKEEEQVAPKSKARVNQDASIKPRTKSSKTPENKSTRSPDKEETLVENENHKQKGAAQVPEPTRRAEDATDQVRVKVGTKQVIVKLEPVVKVQRCKSMAILGTMSDAGKSIITAGLCRILANHGIKVAPFKGQNMSNNAAPALLPDSERKRRLYKSFQKAVGGEFPAPSPGQPDSGYGEIGTAQSLQAEACRLIPRVEMNPVLLKSGGQNEKGEFMCSVLVLGKQVARETYGDLGKRTTNLRTMVLESHQALAEVTDCDVILMEGAGSCTELNLIDRDIVNLPLVRSLHCPWLLVANIDCGGVFAQIVGTRMCVSTRDWSLCAGIIVNKLRGEPKYFEPGPKMIEVSCIARDIENLKIARLPNSNFFSGHGGETCLCCPISSGFEFARRRWCRNRKAAGLGDHRASASRST